MNNLKAIMKEKTVGDDSKPSLLKRKPSNKPAPKFTGLAAKLTGGK